MTAQAARFVALADGATYALVDTNGSRWRCVVHGADGAHRVSYHADAWAALAELDRFRKESV